MLSERLDEKDMDTQQFEDEVNNLAGSSLHTDQTVPIQSEEKQAEPLADVDEEEEVEIDEFDDWMWGSVILYECIVYW